ncbi:unnamed protein product [Haemonchus placei]|uniref:BPTI/Kunitz inhibitor domain-containing protein n=1 Tax=Haemonchus placei TaxID=6290 RepID=A0A3P7X7A2_HAEPC|nr:unnamed protein product [Haemonchus placei]
MGSGGNMNRFVDEVTCMRACGTEYVGAVHGEAYHRAGEEDVSAVHGEAHHTAGEANHALCDLPLQSGNGTFRIPRFYFNKGEEKCEPFDYTGDGGNGNRFLTEEDCEQLCFANRYEKELGFPQGDDSKLTFFALYQKRATCSVSKGYHYAHIIWYGMIWYDMVWYGMVWYGMVWYGMVWYGMVWIIFIVLCIVVFLLIIILIPVLICCVMLATKKGRAAAGLSAASGKPTTNKYAKKSKKPTKGAKAKTK